MDACACDQPLCTQCYQQRMREVPPLVAQELLLRSGINTCLHFCQNIACSWCSALSCPDYDPTHRQREGCTTCFPRGKQRIRIEEVESDDEEKEEKNKAERGQVVPPFCSPRYTFRYRFENEP